MERKTHLQSRQRKSKFVISTPLHHCTRPRTHAGTASQRHSIPLLNSTFASFWILDQNIHHNRSNSTTATRTFKRALELSPLSPPTGLLPSPLSSGRCLLSCIQGPLPLAELHPADFITHFTTREPDRPTRDDKLIVTQTRSNSASASTSASRTRRLLLLPPP